MAEIRYFRLFQGDLSQVDLGFEIWDLRFGSVSVSAGGKESRYPGQIA
jgi:hypothetical protein